MHCAAQSFKKAYLILLVLVTETIINASYGDHLCVHGLYTLDKASTFLHPGHNMDIIPTYST